MMPVIVLAMSFTLLPNEPEVLSRIDQLHHPQGLFLDRTSDPSTISCAATGFGVLALSEGVKRGYREHDAVLSLARTAFHKTVTANPARNRGWLSHFTDPDGLPKSYSEVSTIDTAIFYAGMLRAAEILGDPQFLTEVRTWMARIDLDYVLRDGYFLHGFRWPALMETEDQPAGQPLPEPEFIPHTWNDSSEGVILYRLFQLPFQFQIRRTDYPLFVYCYPLCFFNEPEYETLLNEAIEYQLNRFGYWGITATSGPTGYAVDDPNLISPILISAVGVKYPEHLNKLQALELSSAAISYHLPTRWVSSDDLTIDLASAYVLYARWTPKPLAEAPVAQLVKP